MTICKSTVKIVEQVCLPIPLHSLERKKKHLILQVQLKKSIKMPKHIGAEKPWYRNGLCSEGTR